VAGAKLPVAHLIRPDRLSHQAGSDGGKTNSSPGRARHKPSDHCAGNAGVLRLYLYARVRLYSISCTRDRGCSKHPAFPAPSVLRDKVQTKPRAQCAARTRMRVWSFVAWMSRATSGTTLTPSRISLRSSGLLVTW